MQEDISPSPEKEKRKEELDQFEKIYANWLNYYYENIIEGGLVDTPTPLDPFSINPLQVEEPTSPLDEMYSQLTYDDVDEDQRKRMEEVIFRKFIPDPLMMDDLKEKEYVTLTSLHATVPGRVHVTVYQTQQEDLFLQALYYADGQTQWVIGPMFFI